MIYYRKLHDAYVNVGTIQLEKYYRDGVTHVQGAEQIVGDQHNEALLKKMPTNFHLEWAQFMYPLTDPATLNANKDGHWDQGAYGTGTPTLKREYLNIPTLTKVTLLYKYDTNVNNEARELVELSHKNFAPLTLLNEDGTTTEIETVAEYATILTSQVWQNPQQYFDFLHRLGTLQGFNRNGNALPPFVNRSIVSELMVTSGTIEDDEGNVTNVTVHLAPMYIQNALPMFDLAYFETDDIKWRDPVTGVEKSGSAVSGQVGRLVRWYGGFTSENRAPINYDGAAIPTGSHPDGRSYPLVDQQLVVDGVTYIGADAYNLTRKLN